MPVMKSELAILRDEWLEGDEGKSMADLSTLPKDDPKYLRNRLELAFLAGAQAEVKAQEVVAEKLLEAPFFFSSSEEYKAKKQQALDLISEWGGIDGDHHKKWLLDKLVKLLSYDYEQWVKDYQKGEDGPDTYEWDSGIAP